MGRKRRHLSYCTVIEKPMRSVMAAPPTGATNRMGVPSSSRLRHCRNSECRRSNREPPEAMN